MPASFIGRRVEVRETRDHVEIELDARHVVKHQRLATADHVRVTSPEHRPPRGEGPCQRAPHPEEQAILVAVPQLAPYVDELKRKGRKVIALLLRQLLRLVREYLRIPMMPISHSDLMPIRSERSDAGLPQCELVIGIRQ